MNPLSQGRCTQEIAARLDGSKSLRRSPVRPRLLKSAALPSGGWLITTTNGYHSLLLMSLFCLEQVRHLPHQQFNGVVRDYRRFAFPPSEPGPRRVESEPSLKP